MADKQTYTVNKRGHFYRNADGELVEAEIGSQVELSEREAAGVADRITLESVGTETKVKPHEDKVFTTVGDGKGDQPPSSLEGKTVDEVLAAVEAGEVSREEALAWEQAQEKPRKGVLATLEG